MKKPMYFLQTETAQLYSVFVFVMVVQYRTGDTILSLAMVLALSIHELGHMAAAVYYREEFSGLWYIPFLGAFILTDHIQSRKIRAHITLAGPVIGSLGGILVSLIAMYVFQADEFARKLMFATIFLNGFNLLPLYPLDGGQILKIALSGYIRRLTTPVLLSTLILCIGLLTELIPGFKEFWEFALIFGLFFLILSHYEPPLEDEIQLAGNARTQQMLQKINGEIVDERPFALLSLLVQLILLFVLITIVYIAYA